MSDITEALDQIKRAAQDQLEITKQSLANNIAAADLIHARNTSKTLVNIAEYLNTNPQPPANVTQ